MLGDPVLVLLHRHACLRLHSLHLIHRLLHHLHMLLHELLALGRFRFWPALASPLLRRVRAEAIVARDPDRQTPPQAENLPMRQVRQLQSLLS